MAEQILKNVKFYIGGYDLTGDMNEVTLSEKIDVLDVTKFGSNSRQRTAGLSDVEFTAGGFWNASSAINQGTTYQKIDPVAFNKLGTSQAALTVLPNGTGLGDIAYSAGGLLAEYSPGGSIGDMLGYTIAANGNGQLSRGKLVMRGLVSTDWGGANTSTGQNIGTGTTQKRIATAIHVLGTSGASGGAIGVKIQASTDSAFGGVPKTLYATTLTTGLSGQSIFLTTKNPSTSYSYVRVKTSQNGALAKRFKVVLTVGHQKRRQ